MDFFWELTITTPESPLRNTRITLLSLDCGSKLKAFSSTISVYVKYVLCCFVVLNAFLVTFADNPEFLMNEILVSLVSELR